jgi:hypothetical protein
VVCTSVSFPSRSQLPKGPKKKVSSRLGWLRRGLGECSRLRSQRFVIDNVVVDVPLNFACRQKEYRLFVSKKIWWSAMVLILVEAVY